MKIWLKRVLIIGVGVLFLSMTALEGVEIFAKHKGVETVSVPPSSVLMSQVEKGDYVDAYRIRIPGEISIEDWINHIGRGPGAIKEYKDVPKPQNEVIMEGRAPGLSFKVSYCLTKEGSSTWVTLSTLVFYHNTLGRLYFFPVKQVHKHSLPYYLWNQSRGLEGPGSEGPGKM